MRTGDQSYIKELNKSIAVKILRNHKSISRTQISKVSGLNKATVSSIVDELIDSGLAVEQGRGHSAVGRRPVLLHFNARAGYAVGIEVAVGYLRGVLTDLAGNPIEIIHQPFENSNKTKVALEQINDLISNLIKLAPESSLGILGIGIGVPGLVNFSKGIILNAPNLGWTDFPLRSMLETQWNFPIFVDNEANAGVLGEKQFGIGKDVSNLVYISAGGGLGTGIIVANELIRGADGLSGEFGHMTIETQGLRCSCGNRGCLETYASERYLTERYRQMTGFSIDFDTIVEKLNNHDDDAIEAVHSAGHYLGIGISNIINAINPTLVIIGNRFADLGMHLVNSVNHTIQERCFIKPYSSVTVHLTELGANACSIGAASLVLDRYFTGPNTSF